MNKTTFVTIFLIGLLEIPLAFAESDVSPLIGPNQVITYSGIAGGQSEMQANCELQTVINPVKLESAFLVHDKKPHQA